MIFQGIATPIRYSDPEYFRYELRLHWNYLAARFIAFNIQITASVKAFGISMNKAAESMGQLLKVLNKGR